MRSTYSIGSVNCQSIAWLEAIEALVMDVGNTSSNNRKSSRKINPIRSIGQLLFGCPKRLRALIAS